MGTRDRLESSARRALDRAKQSEGKLAGAAVGTAAAAAAAVGLRRLVSDGAGRRDDAAYRLLAGEPTAEGIRRIVLARVDDALLELGGASDSDPPEAIHQARKDIKKVRATIRLVHSELGEEIYRRENTHHRDAGRRLSALRDAEVRVETLDALADRFDGVRERYAALAEQFEAELQKARRGGSFQQGMGAAADALSAGRERIESWPLNTDGWELIAPGIHRTYRRGRKRLREAEEEASDERLHEWRKRVKDLWYQLRLIREADPEALGQLIDECDDLADYLGDDHDLALLREEALARSGAFAESGDQRLLLELIDRRRDELQSAAYSLGRRLYREKPKRFVKRLERRFNASPLAT